MKIANWLRTKLWIYALGVILLFIFIGAIHAIYIQKTANQVAEIYATKLSYNDVIDTNLSPDPGAQSDQTIQGIDANNNGIRDDVELAIFKAYPNSAKTRAVLLQYALALQNETKLSLINKATVIAAVQEESRGFVCIGSILSQDNLQKFNQDADSLAEFVEQRQLNTIQRKEYRTSFLRKIGNYKSLGKTCDINYSTLPN
jgi:hypothetical protein